MNSTNTTALVQQKLRAVARWIRHNKMATAVGMIFIFVELVLGVPVNNESYFQFRSLLKPVLGFVLNPLVVELPSLLLIPLSILAVWYIPMLWQHRTGKIIIVLILVANLFSGGLCLFLSGQYWQAHRSCEHFDGANGIHLDFYMEGDDWSIGQIHLFGLVTHDAGKSWHQFMYQFSDDQYDLKMDCENTTHLRLAGIE